ncbi:hypothetical protein TNCV_693261 [Trichonephila clavipes]|nr:hypothetical protein TNCV_693261 [Trichonephila clavipes]
MVPKLNYVAPYHEPQLGQMEAGNCKAKANQVEFVLHKVLSVRGHIKRNEGSKWPPTANAWLDLHHRIEHHGHWSGS